MTIAVLYAERHGTYAQVGDLDLWCEQRDARGYQGPWPIIAHPPCAEWGRLRELRRSLGGVRSEDGLLGPLAVTQVRRWGGVLEHPAGSALWKHMTMPRPGDLPDEWGGYTIAIDQAAFGHRATKRTWLYLVRCHWNHPNPARSGTGTLVNCSRRQRKATPLALALALVECAHSAS